MNTDLKIALCIGIGLSVGFLTGIFLIELFLK